MGIGRTCGGAAINRDDIRRLLAECGLSQRGAARLLGINERTMRRYVLGELPVPKAIELALLGMRRLKLDGERGNPRT